MKCEVLEKLEILEQLVTSCTTKWIIGCDAEGYEQFICTIDQLDSLVELHYESISNQQDQLILLAEELEQYVQNKDLIGISDVLQYQMKPLLREWIKGCQAG